MKQRVIPSTEEREESRWWRPRPDSSPSARLGMTVALVMLFVLVGCKRGLEKGHEQQVETETIAPAAAKPAPTTTGELTQTVDIEDSRSDAEGGGIGSTATSGSAAPAKKTTKAPPKRKRKG